MASADNNPHCYARLCAVAERNFEEEVVESQLEGARAVGTDSGAPLDYTGDAASLAEGSLDDDRIDRQ